MFKRKFLRSSKRLNEKKYKGSSTKTDEHGDVGEASGIDMKSEMASGCNEEEKVQQKPKEMTDAEKYEKLLQEALEKGDERETSKACIRLQHACKIIGKTPKTCIALGHVYRKDGDKEAASYYYEKAFEIAQKQKDKFYQTEALRGLGHTYREAGENEKAIGYYKQALPLAQAGTNKTQVAEVFLGLAHAYESNEQYVVAIETYKMTKEIAKEHDCKWEEKEACRGLGKTYRDLGDNKTAQQYFHEALDIAPKETYKKNESVIYIGLAHTYRSNGEYENAIESYEKAIKMLAEGSDNVWEEMSAYLGLGYCLIKMDKIKEGEEYFVKAEKTAEKKWDILPVVLHTMNHPSLTDVVTTDQTPEEEENNKKEESHQQKTFPLNEPKESDQKASITIVAEGLPEVADTSPVRPEDPNTITVEIVEKTPPRKVLVKKIPDVYTYQASIEDGLTEEIKKKMAEDVKISAYVNLLNQSDGKFSGDDRPIYDMAKNCVCKNDRTDRPGRLTNLLAQLNRSIGRITCGDAQGTCFLVAGNFVITCLHVYLDFIKERQETQQPTMPIKVAFHYYEVDELLVEIDESQEPMYHSRAFDYILLCLKQSSHLESRVRLGEFVEGCHLYQGLVCITGFPDGMELMEETCVIVEADSEERLKRRQLQMNGGIHMTRVDAFFKEYPQRLAYDTSLYRGSSGSPGFDMNGKIQVLHAQGYDLDVEGKKYSLMEFGVKFSAICEDLESRFNVAKQFFPNWNPEDDVEPMEAE